MRGTVPVIAMIIAFRVNAGGQARSSNWSKRPQGQIRRVLARNNVGLPLPAISQVTAVDDQFGTHKVIDVLVSEKRDLATTRRFFTHALAYGLSPIEVTTDHAAAYPRVLDELVPGAWCLVPGAWCLVPVMSPSNTETTRSKPITDG
jgi:hypothetical protein